jgi:alkylation response protein AidB-like acyl-CoA dehydrogenase
MIISVSPSQQHDRQPARCSARATSDNFTIFEGTSEIQRMIIGRAVTGLDVR